MEKFYCEYCGSEYSSVRSLTGGSCSHSPTKRHVLYEGTEKGRLVQDRAWRDRPGWRESQYSGRYAGIPDSEPVPAGGECDARAAR